MTQFILEGNRKQAVVKRGWGEESKQKKQNAQNLEIRVRMMLGPANMSAVSEDRV